MRLSVFLLLAAGVSVVVAVLSGLAGVGFWASVGRGAGILVLLQIGYFVFLVMSARKADQSDVGDNGE